MCLYISDESIEKAKQARDRGKKIVAWKVMWEVLKNFEDIRKDSLYSGIFRKEWRPNKTGMYHSDRKAVQLTDAEKRHRQVEHGLHFYGTRELARAAKAEADLRVEEENARLVVVKLEIDPTDLVAYGTSVNFLNRDSELVATKAKLVGISR